MLNLKPSKQLFLKGICGLFLSITPVSLTAIETAIEYPDYQTSFEKINRHCEVKTNPRVNQSNLTTKDEKATREIECYANAMVKLMRSEPQYRELILQSAMKQRPKATPNLVEVALKAGMAPLVVLMRALEIYPKNNEEIGQAAMRSGVDPIVVTEATSAIQN